METINQTQTLATKKANYRSWGLFLAITPSVLFFVIMLITIVSPVLVSQNTVWIFQIVAIFTGIFGMALVFGLLFGTPIGIILLGMSARLFEGQSDARSGQGIPSAVPAEIKGWNWGAAGLSWLWGASNNVWISFLSFVPVIGAFMWIVLGIKGNEWAWQSAPWQSVEQFKMVQNKWKIWGIVSIVMHILPLLFIVKFILFPAHYTNGVR